MTVALVLAVPVTTSVAIRAAEAAACVRVGTAVEAVQVAGVPLVDVAARKVIVSWIGDPEQKPTLLFGTGEDPVPVIGLLLGQNGDSIIVRVAPDGQIARIPTDQVTTTVFLGDPAAQPSGCTP